jgi:hypothetical protein
MDKNPQFVLSVLSYIIYFVALLYFSMNGKSKVVALTIYLSIYILLLVGSLIVFMSTMPQTTAAGSTPTGQSTSSTLQVVSMFVPLFGMCVVFAWTLYLVLNNYNSIVQQHVSSYYSSITMWFVIGSILFAAYLINFAPGLYASFSWPLYANSLFLIGCLTLSILFLNAFKDIFERYRADGFQTIRNDGFNVYPHSR